MNKPVVLHLIHHLRLGGAERLVCDLLPCLAELGFQVHVACLNERGPLFAELERQGIPAHFLGRRRGIDLAAVWRLRQLLCQARVALINTHSFSAGFWGRLAALAAGTPRVVTTVHTVAGWSQPRKQFVGNQLLLPATDRIVAVSARVRESLIVRGRLPAGRITVIPNGIRLERFAPTADRMVARRRLGLPADRVLVGMVARCSAEKGGAFWVRALGQLVAEKLPVHGVLVGDGPELPAWRALAEACGASGHVTFAGYQTDVAPWLAVLDVLVCPSLQESFGMTAIEGQAMRVPVVATRIDGFLETLHDDTDALLVPPSDAGALCVAIKRLIESSALGARMAEAGWRKAHARFAIQRTAEAYARLYRELLNAGNPPRDDGIA